jgi:hypothetical protein
MYPYRHAVRLIVGFAALMAILVLGTTLPALAAML